jgi:trimethylamine:corrinoid methyltransferase-like protein
MVENAREEARRILAGHEPKQLDPALEKEIDGFVEAVSKRTIEDFEAAEWES